MIRRVPDASENLATKMRESLKRFWNKIKWGLFLIIYTAGVIGWCYFYQEFKVIRCEANWAYSEAVKIHQQDAEIKSGELNPESGEAVKATSFADSREENEEGDLILPSPSGEIEKVIYNYFKDDYQIAKAVFTAESGLRNDAQGWNCHYNGKSAACKPEDRKDAWSVDCGIAQINVIGKTCPQELFDPDENLKVARKKYESRKWQPWCAYTSGSYKKYLAYVQ